MVPINSKNSEF